MAKIEIILQSDLCAASGEGFSSVIDTDVCYDELGIPYIPSRRLKGCLKEAAEFIGAKNIDDIFGVSAAKTGGALKFSSDARPAGFSDIVKDVQDAGRERTLDLFTYVRASTKISDEGSAEKESLRFTRVVKKHPQPSAGPLTFEAECELDQKYEAEMERICKALRSVGYKRNRGFGAIRCRFSPDLQPAAVSDGQSLDPDTEYQLPVKITNTQPLLLSAGNDDDTLDYLSGTMVLGALAWMYPDKSNPDFAEIFLKDGVVVSNFYPGDLPVPLCYAETKIGGEYINTLVDETGENDSAKMIRRGYMESDGTIIEPKKEVVYHHRKNSEDGALLYTQTALSVGYSFRGSITGKGRYLKQILPLLQAGSVRLGRSRTAQYGYCSVETGDLEPVSEATITANGDDVAVVLQSDILLLKDGAFSWDAGELDNEIITRLNPGAGGDIKYDEKHSSLLYKVVTGYSGIWNLKKPQAKAFKAGSVLVYRNVSGIIPVEIVIGARVNEGFGKCIAMPVSQMPKAHEPERTPAPVRGEGEYARILEKERKTGRIRELAIEFAKRNRANKKNPLVEVGTAQLMRVREMAEAAKNEDMFRDYVGSIKSASIKDAFSRYINRAGEEAEKKGLAFSDYGEYRLFIDTALKCQYYNNKKKEALGN